MSRVGDFPDFLPDGKERGSRDVALNEIRPKYYDPKRPPAASKAMVKDVGSIKAGVSMDMIGVVIEK